MNKGKDYEPGQDLEFHIVGQGYGWIEGDHCLVTLVEDNDGCYGRATHMPYAVLQDILKWIRQNGEARN